MVYEVIFVLTVKAENENNAIEKAIAVAHDDLSREHLANVLDVSDKVFIDEE